MNPALTSLTWTDLPGATLLTVPPSGLRFRFVADTGPRPSADVGGAWREMRLANDRLHDGHIIVVNEIEGVEAGADGGGLVIQCSRRRYMDLATQHHPSVGDHGIRLLGVKGLITGRDRAGREHVLIARRGTQTRVYGGMWEIAPGGGVDAASTASEITHDDIARSLVHEATEEMGVNLSPADCDPVRAMVMDDRAFSLDLIMPVRWPGIVDPRRGLCAADGCEWEYLDVAWVAIDEVGGFAAKNAAAITPPTLAVWRWRNWTEPSGQSHSTE
ncbi:MAG: hypothetical protein ACREJO_10550 [Phycisphaerales bacterium]